MDCKDGVCEIDYGQDAIAQAVDRFGKSQVNLCMEECAELIQALSKWYRDIPNNANIAEEIADVQIMLEQMIVFFGNADEVAKWREFKIERLEGILNE